MANRYGDPKVKAWMKEHPGEVERIEKLYGILKDMEFGALTKLAQEVGVDVDRHWDKLRSALITDIVKTASEKALAIVSGQGFLLTSGPNKRG